MSFLKSIAALAMSIRGSEALPHAADYVARVAPPPVRPPVRPPRYVDEGERLTPKERKRLRLARRARIKSGISGAGLWRKFANGKNVRGH